MTAHALPVSAAPAPVASAAPPADLLDDPLELARFTRFQGGSADEPALAESALRIGGMHCASCGAIIEQALGDQPGVVQARVNAAAQSALVRWDPRRTRMSTLVAALERAGYSAVPDTAAAARTLRQRELRRALWRLFVASFCAMQVMMMATPRYVAGAGGLEPDIAHLLDWGGWLLTLPVLLFSAAPFFTGAWRALRQRRIGMDVPVALGIAVAFIGSSGAAFDPGGPFGHEVYFDSLTMFVSFLLGGRFLELRARHRAANALEESLEGQSHTALRLDEHDRAKTVSVLRLQPGDRVRVPVGQAFPADGTVLTGHTAADESLLSGESRAVPKASGDDVVAGSLNLLAPVVMRVQRTGADTRHEAILALMREAQQHRPRLLASADRWAAPFLWGVLVLAGLGALAWQWVDPSRALWVAVSVLIVTCPCALSLAAPSALLAAAGALARRGVLLRRLDAIEGLAHLQHVFLDKTGTLTEGRLQLAGLQPTVPATGWDTPTLLAHAATLAGWSAHPLSQALHAAAPAGPVPAWTDVAEQPGQGVQGTDAQGRVWRLGRAAWAGTGSPDEPAAADGQAHTWLGCDGVRLARILFTERLRPQAADAVQALQQAGLQVTLLSGDAPERAHALSQRLQAEAGQPLTAEGGLLLNAEGGLMPQDKLARLRAAQARGEVVAMVGDGINDAPVLAQADVSLAMGEGALAARVGADGVLVHNDLGQLVQARALALRTLRVMRQNMAWAAAYNALCVPLALLGWLPPWAAGLGMACSSLFVVLNSLRLSR